MALSKTVVLVQLQVRRVPGEPEIELIAGQLRNHFYAFSFPWSDGNMGRVVPMQTFEAFYERYKQLRDDFQRAAKNLSKKYEPERFGLVLTVLPFPDMDRAYRMMPEKGRDVSAMMVLDAPRHITAVVEGRFERRICMLKGAIEEGKRFYLSLLEELEAIVDVGLYLRDDLPPSLVSRLQGAKSDILCHSADAIRQSTSLREDITNICGALL